MAHERITMGTKTFLSAVRREGLVAELRTPAGDQVGFFGRTSGVDDAAEGRADPDVVAVLLPSEGTCDVRGETLLGQLFLSLVREAA